MTGYGLRIALWPDETSEEHRHYAASILERPDAIALDYEADVTPQSWKISSEPQASRVKSSSPKAMITAHAMMVAYW